MLSKKKKKIEIYTYKRKSGGNHLNNENREYLTLIFITREFEI